MRRFTGLATLCLTATLARTTLAQELANDDPYETELSHATHQPGGLMAGDVARRSVATSSSMAAKHYDVEAAESVQDQAAVGFAPRLTLTGRYTRYSSIDPPVLGIAVASPGAQPGALPAGSPLVAVPLQLPVLLNSTLAQASVTVPVSDYILKISQNYAAASHAVLSAKYAAEAQADSERANARIAYYEWARSVLALIVSESALGQAQAHLHDVQAAYTAGASSSADVSRVEAQVASTEQLVTRARNLRDQATERLRTLMHVDGTSTFAIGEDVAAPLSDTPCGAPAALYAEAIGHRPELRALAETGLSLEGKTSVTRAAAFPHLDAVGEVTTADPNPRYIPPQDRFDTTWSVGVVLTWSPNDAFGYGAASAAIDSQRDAVEAQRRALEDALRLEVTDARRACLDAAGAIETSRRALASATESYRVRRSLFRAGRATSVELTDAETELLRARLDAIYATLDQRVAHVRLEHATGRDAGRAG
jgi:outer membrane protein TolC